MRTCCSVHAWNYALADDSVIDTAQSAGRSIHAGVALGQYLSQAHTHSTFSPVHNWPGLPGLLDPLLWLVYITGSFTATPTLRPRLAFLPASASRSATEVLLHRDSAAALAVAERRLQENRGGDTSMAAPDDAVRCSCSKLRPVCLFLLV